MKFWHRLSEKLNFLACPACSSGNGYGINELCDDCRKKLVFFSDFCCKNCGGELDGVLGCCSKCLKEGVRPFDEAASVFAYRDFGRDIVLKFKSADALPFGRIFGRMAADRLLEYYAHWEFDMIVPVPLHWSRRFSRTYNQSAIFAEFLAERLHVPCVHKALRRVKRTRSQKFLSGKERHNNLRDAFKGRPELVKNRKILLADDIFTTGATLSCCAEELKKCGAERIYVISIARA